MQKLSKKSNILIVTGAVMLLVFIYFQSENLEKPIKEEQAQTTAIVTKVNVGYRGGITMDYRFFQNGKSYSGSRKVFISSSYLEKFKGKTFAVVYNKLEPRENKLLLLADDFKDFNLTYPDSLLWVEILKEKSL